MKLFKRILIIILVVFLGVGGVYVYTTYQATQTAQAAAQSIETAVLQKGEVQVTIGATGTVRSRQTAQLSWSTAGVIESVAVKNGDVVTAGQTLASLVLTSLPQSVIMAQSDLVSDQQALEDLTTSAAEQRVKALSNITTYEAAVRDARYSLENFTVPSNQARLTMAEALTQAKKALETASAAFEPYRLASQADATRKELLVDLNTAQADYNSAVKRLQLQYDLQVAQANLDQALSSLEKYKDGPNAKEVAAAKAKIASAQATLNQAYILAPFDATITAIEAQPGDMVAGGTSAFRLDNLKDLYVDVSVSEVDIHQVKAGQPVTITFDALRSSAYHGTVTEVSRVSSSADSSVTFTVTVHVTDADQSVYPGMTAEVSIIVASKADALLAPLQAVTDLNGTSMVYRMNPGPGIGAAEAVTVTVGLSSDTYAELTGGGLKVGDQVVINPDQVAGVISTSSQSNRGGAFGIMGMLGGGGPPPNRSSSSSSSSNNADAGGPPPGGAGMP